MIASRVFCSVYPGAFGFKRVGSQMPGRMFELCKLRLNSCLANVSAA